MTGGNSATGTRVHRDQPTQVATDLDLVAITASVHTTCALAATGRAYCWGRNEFGAVGNGVAGEGTVELRPTAVAGTARFRTLGSGAPCALELDGRAYCWGFVSGSFDPDHYIAPGDCTTAYYHWYQGEQCVVPTPIATEVRFASLAGGGCGLTDSGEAYCWGDGSSGTLGDGRTGVYSVSPVRVDGEIQFQGLAAGSGHVCGLDVDGAAHCWGNNFRGQLGIGENGASGGILFLAVPTRVATDIRFVAVVAGSAHTCALSAEETVWCWGTTFSDVPVPIELPAS